jgi:transcriptional regulator with XRE-family HTH domain
MNDMEQEERMPMATKAPPANQLAVKVGERIRALRIARGMKQEALALEVGYSSRGTIAQFENGLALPSIDKAVAIAEFFRIPLDALVKEEDEYCEESLLLTLRQMAMGCPEEQRKTIAAYCRTFADALEAS